MPIKTVTFDWGDTLASNFGMPYLATQRRAFTRLRDDLAAAGCGDAPASIQPWMDALAGSWRSSIDRTANPECKEFDFAGMLSGWAASAGALGADAHKVAAAIHRCTATLTDTVIPFSETAPTLSLLKARGLRIGIISHVPWPGDACRAWFERHGLAAYIGFYSLSCEVGWIKPSPRHYRHALDQCGCAPGEVLHVGDHPWRDVEGARSHGMKTCLRRTEGIYPEAELDACKPDAEILHLGEILGVVERMRS